MEKKGGFVLAVLSPVAFVMSMVLFVAIMGGGGVVDQTEVLKPSPLNPGQIPTEYRAWVEKAGALCSSEVTPPAIDIHPAYPVTAPVIAAQIDAESSWNPRAVSHQGAQGLAQFMPATWPAYAKDDAGDGNISPFNPPDAIMAQARYMCDLSRQMYKAQREPFRTLRGELLDLALAAYNAGPNAVYLAGGVPHNGETEKYVQRIRGLIPKYSGSVTPPPGGSLAQKIIFFAQKQTGQPYSWGGGDFNGPSRGGDGRGGTNVGFDCSGLVLYAAYQASGGGLKLPHLADLQARMGQHVDIAVMQPGDIIGFSSTPFLSKYHHIGIYLGNNQMIDAPDFGQSVGVHSLDTPYYKKQTWEVRRLG